MFCKHAYICVLAVILLKTTTFIVFLLINLNLFGQNLTEKVGQIEVQLIQHNFIRNSDYELTKKITNRKNRPYQKLYFDSVGTLLKSISFGKHHNTDLRLTNNIKLFKYENEKLIECIEYESDYQKNVYPNWKSKYIYNKKGELIDESTFYYESDSLFFKTTYEYDVNSNRIKSLFNPTYYYKRDFDSINRITSLKQIHDNKIRWEWNYNYSENKRIGNFQTHYNDGEDYSKKEIQIYNDKGLVIETEEKHISKSGLNKKKKFFYDKNGVIKKIEFYESYSSGKNYELISYKEIKIKSKASIDIEIAKKINEQIDF